MPLPYTPQKKISEQQKYTKANNCVWKLTPVVPEDVISNTQQCETVKRFWICPLQRGPKWPNTAVVENPLRGVVLSVLLKGSWCSEPLQQHHWLPGRQGRTGTTEIRQYVSASVAPTYWITSGSFSHSHTLLIMLLELFGSFFKVMEITLGNRARIPRARGAVRATALLASPSSCSGLPCCSLGYVP